MSDLVKKWVCGGLEEEVWKAWEVGEAWILLMTLRETPCCSLTSAHWEKTCALHHPRLENCLDCACEEEEGAYGDFKKRKKNKAGINAKTRNMTIMRVHSSWEKVLYLIG